MTNLPDLSRFASRDERLREVATDEGAVEAALEEALALLDSERNRGREVEQARLLGYVGNAERLLGRHDEAIGHLCEALAIAMDSGDERARAVALIRLGEAHRCADSFPEAERCLEEALSLVDAHGLKDLEDFALQHLGKTYLDEGDVARARECLGRALALREARGDEALVASTRLALERADRL